MVKELKTFTLVWPEGCGGADGDTGGGGGSTGGGGRGGSIKSVTKLKTITYLLLSVNVSE